MLATAQSNRHCLTQHTARIGHQPLSCCAGEPADAAVADRQFVQLLLLLTGNLYSCCQRLPVYGL
jgi:hypothetical protein